MPDGIEQTTQRFQDFFASPTGVPFPSLFDPITTEQFEEQAGREVTPFFEENLANAVKQIELAKTQQKEAKELSEQQQQETFTEFKGVADRSFAKALGRASGRFAGKGTATSGFRREAFSDFFGGKEEILTEAEREDRQATETREQGFSQFLGRSELEEEGTRLRIEREKRAEQAARQQQLFTGAVTARESGQEAFETNFARFLGDKLGA